MDHSSWDMGGLRLMYRRNNATGHLSPPVWNILGWIVALRSKLQAWFSLAVQKTQQIQSHRHLSCFWNPPVSFRDVPAFHGDQIVGWVATTLDSGVLPPSFSLFQRISSSASSHSCRALFWALCRSQPTASEAVSLFRFEELNSLPRTMDSLYP